MLHAIAHTLAHILGMDDPAGGFYLAYSGWVADLSLIGGAWAIYHAHNCHARFCPWIGKHRVNGTPYCTKHHPEGR